MKTKTFKQTVIFKASPHDVYEALMDSKKHSEFSESKANISRDVGGKFTAYDGWIHGENLELVQDKKIVQTWRGNDKSWPKGHNSRVTFELKKVKEGTELKFTHDDVPEDWYDDLSKGWEEQYWAKMRKMLEK